MVPLMVGRKIALVTKQGTACSETVLTAGEDTPAMRARIERQYCDGRNDSPIAGSWTDVTNNEAC